MKSEIAKRNVVSENNTAIRNPFGVMDVPNPNDDDVTHYARGFEDRFQHQHCCCHADPIPQRRHAPSGLSLPLAFAMTRVWWGPVDKSPA